MLKKIHFGERAKFAQQITAANVVLYPFRQAISFEGAFDKFTVIKEISRTYKAHSGEKTNKCSQCDFASSPNPETTLMAPFLTETYMSQPRTIPKLHLTYWFRNNLLSYSRVKVC